MQRKIREFIIDGVAIDGETIIRLRPLVEEAAIQELRQRGYVPVIDKETELTWEYDKENNRFNYWVKLYMVYIGKKKAYEILGMIGSRPIFIEK